MQNAAISIECFPGQDRPVGIHIERPVHAARVFEGKSPAEVLQLVPMLFAVCGMAQSVAAAYALAAAAGERPSPALERARGALVRIEIAREHLWRALIDWPRFIRYEPHADAFSTMQSLMPRARKSLFVDGVIDARQTVHLDRTALNALLADFDRLLEAEVIGIAPAEWLALGTRDDLDDYRARASGVVPTLLEMIASAGWDSTCAGSGEFLPRMAFGELEKAFINGSADHFVELPDWQGRPCETSPLSRQQGMPLLDALADSGNVGLLVRVIAAVTELAATSRDVFAILDGGLEPGVEAACVAPGTGIAQVEAARGRLVHRAVIEDELVASYRIVAPTEWNFHPGGVVSRVLGGLSGADREGARNQADLFVTLMDPCVAHSVEVH